MDGESSYIKRIAELKKSLEASCSTCSVIHTSRLIKGRTRLSVRGHICQCKLAIREGTGKHIVRFD